MQNEIETILKKNLNFSFKILNLYLFGSRLSGCHTKDSDYDFICIIESNRSIYGIHTIIEGIYNINIYHYEYFLKLIENNVIFMVKCLFLPKEFILMETVKPKFQLRKLELLRCLELDLDHHLAKSKYQWKEDIKVGKKNFIHGLRWAYFTIQLLEKGCIYDFSEGNNDWKEVILYHLTTDL